MKKNTLLDACTTIWSRLTKPQPLRAFVDAVIVLAGAALPCATQAGTFADSFSARLNTNYWTINQDTPGLYTADLSQGNLHFAKTDMTVPGGGAYIVAALNLAAVGGSISNDFSVQTHFDNAVLPDSVNGGVNLAHLGLAFQDGTGFGLERVGAYWSAPFLCVYNGNANQGTIYTTATDGTLTATRTGSTVSFYFNGTFIYSQVETTPLVYVDIALYNTVGNDSTAVTYDSFSLTGSTVTDSPLRIVTPPVSQTVSAGANATFNAAATGLTPLNYQWQFNNTNIVWGTNASLTITNVQPANVGSYQVIVSNPSTSMTSQTATLATVGIQMFAGVVVNGPVGSNYLIQATSNLSGGWNTLTNVALPSQPYIYIDYNSPTNRQQFYQALPQ